MEALLAKQTPDDSADWCGERVVGEGGAGLGRKG